MDHKKGTPAAYCLDCARWLDTPDQWDNHGKGKKHQNLLQKPQAARRKLEAVPRRRTELSMLEGVLEFDEHDPVLCSAPLPCGPDPPANSPGRPDMSPEK
eukprot:5000055-Heterocapsa_arctica.AAC.1